MAQINADENTNYKLTSAILAKSAGTIDLKMTENDISYKIRGAIFKVYNELGPGLLESAY